MGQWQDRPALDQSRRPDHHYRTRKWRDQVRASATFNDKNYSRSLTGEESGKRIRSSLTKRLLKATTRMRKSPPPIHEQLNIDSGFTRSVRTINTGLS